MSTWQTPAAEPANSTLNSQRICRGLAPLPACRKANGRADKRFLARQIGKAPAGWADKASIDDPISSHENRLRDRNAERPGAVEVHDEFEHRGLLDRQVSWLRALEDAIDEIRGPTIAFDQ